MIKGRMLSHNAVVVAESPQSVHLVEKDAEVIEMTLADFESAARVDVSGPRVAGAAGRLWRVLDAQAKGKNDGRVKGRWNVDAVASAALRHAKMSVGTRRGAAFDLLYLGKHVMLPALELSASEIAWYCAWAGAAAGDAAALVGWLEQLPPHGYALRTRLLLSRAVDLLRDGALAARAVAASGTPEAGDLDAHALRAALAPPGTADVIAPLVPFAVAAERADGRLAAWASAIAGLALPEAPFPDTVPSAQALDAYLRFRSDGRCAADVNLLRLVPLPLLDEMIEKDAIAPALAARPGWPEAAVPYLRCRLTPGAASIAELRQTGFTAELARRYFLAADDSELRALPSGDPAARHYQALAAWRAGGTGKLDDLRAPARRVLGLLDPLRKAAKAGEEVIVPEELVADPTCWPLLWSSALQGSLRLADGSAGRYPRFADWLDLCVIQRMLFESRWAEAIAAGQRLTARTALEVTSDEALNMVAFAQFQLGQPVTALRTLDEALGGRYTTGLLVNASIAAATQGSVAALPYLARITTTDPDPAVRSGACERALELWAQDGDSPEYPEILRNLVRFALGEPQQDELYRRLLRVADEQDTKWLADAKVHVAGPEQAAAERYWRTWARAKADGYAESVLHVAVVLGELARPATAPEWVKSELRQFTEIINESVHVPFGEAPGLAPVIETLANAGVLETDDRLVLTAQAGAHVVSAQAKDGQLADDDFVRRMLFAPVREYLERQSELDEGVGIEVTRCAVVAANAVAVAADDLWDNGAERWNALEQLRRNVQGNYNLADYAKNRQLADIREQQAALHSLRAALIARLRAHHDSLSGLPLTEEQADFKAALGKVINAWAAEQGRLRVY